MAFRRLHHVIQHLRSTATAAFSTGRRTRRPNSVLRRDLAAALGCGRYGIEHLEARTLLTTISGFTDDVFEYRDEHDQVIRVKATGNIVAELIGAQVNRRTNQITLVNLPGELNDRPVFGGIDPQGAVDPIGPVFVPPSGVGTIQAVAGAPNGELYAFNSVVVGANSVHQLVRLTPLPTPTVLGSVDGLVNGTVITEFSGTAGFGDPTQALVISGADVLPNGLIVFVARTGADSIGLFTINPAVPDSPPSFLGTLDVRPGAADDPLPVMTSIVALSNQQLVGVVNGENGVEESVLLEIDLANPTVSPDPTPIVNEGGDAIGRIVGLEQDLGTDELIAVQAGADNLVDDRVFQVFFGGIGGQRGLAFDLGPVGSATLTSLAFLPGYEDPFTGETRGSYVAFDAGSGTLVNVDVRDRLPAQFLWNIYVSQSDLTGQLSIGYVREFDDDPFPDPYVIRPFEGNVGVLRVFDAQTGDDFLVSPNDNTGNVLLGAHSQNIDPDIDDEDLIPFEIADLPASIDFGVVPAGISALRPGLIVEEGQDLGKFLLGGTFTGAVDARGSIDFFYAGWLLTGSVTGQPPGAIERPDNFNVAGDLRNLVVLDDIGTAGLVGDAPAYLTGFDLRVGGTLGQVTAGRFLDPERDDPIIASAVGSAIAGSIEVNHLPNAPRIERNQFEAEFHTISDEFGFEQFNFGGSPFTFNDTFNTAEYLGSIASGDLGRAEVVRLSGTLQHVDDDDFNDTTWDDENPRDDATGDYADFYAVALMAGQRYTARVQGVPRGLISLGVFDPDGRLIATDYSNPGQRFTQEQFFSFVADRPGAYRFAVSATGDAPDFVGAAPNVGIVPYTLTVVGIGDLALGGIVAAGPILDVFDPLSYDPGIEVFVGDLGVVRSYGTFRSDNTDTLVIERGNMRAIEAADIGEATLGTGTVAAVSGAPTADVPQGSVGLIRSGGANFPFDQSPIAEDVDGADVGGGALIYNLGNARPIGGDYQLIDGTNGSVLVNLIADRGIGVVRAGTMSIGRSNFAVNADDRGEDGIIDLIDVEFDMGNDIDGGPSITTGTGGNVRYIRVLGTVYRDVFFGDPRPIEFVVTEPGSGQTIVDDSGAVVRLTPIGNVRRNALADPQFPQSGIPAFVGPQLYVTSYGVRDHGGSVIIDVSSQGGLEVDVSGGRSAEIGRIEVQGVGVEVLNGPDVADPNEPLGTRETFVTAAGTIRPPQDNQGGGGNDVVDIDGDPDFEPGQRRVRPEDLNVIIRGDEGTTVDVLNIVVIDTGADTAGNEDGEIDLATGRLAIDEETGLPTDTGNSNELRLEDGFFLGEVAGNEPLIETGGPQLPDLAQLGNAFRIVNNTPGEIVNLIAESVVELSTGGSLGMGRNHTGADIVGNEFLEVNSDLPIIPVIGRRAREVYPLGQRVLGTYGYFLGETNAIQLAGGNAMSIRAGQAIGNIAVQGSIGTIVANADGRDEPGVFEGIAGVVSTYGFQGVDQTIEIGRIFDVRIGEGIAPSGSGNFAEAGVFAYNSIRRITGEDADIRGDIQVLNGITIPDVQEVEEGRPQRVGNIRIDSDDTSTEITVIGVDRPRGIETVAIRNGSIINSDIMITSNPQDVEEFDPERFVVGLLDSLDNPIYEIGSVTTNGNGGIIGANIQGSDIGRVAATGSGAFGILASFIGGEVFVADDVINIIEADGYGIRDVQIIPSASLNSLIANGDGTNLSTNAVNARVRFSEQEVSDPLVGNLDPFFGTPPNPLTDIHAFLGTSKDQPEISGVTDTGIISAVDARGQRTLGKVRAWQIRNGTNFDFANSIRNLDVRDIINGLEITTGTIKSFRLDRDAFALGVNVTGRVRKIDIRGSLAGGSVIRTKGDGGSFDSVNVSGNLIGNINSSRAIKNITIGGDFTGNVSVNGAKKGLGIKTLKVGGTFIAGSLDVVGGIGNIQTAGSLGALGDTLTVNGSVKKIMVGGDLRSNLRVSGNLKLLFVRGSIVDGGLPNGLLIDVSGTLNSLVVGGDIQSGVTINAANIKRQKIGGQNAGTIVIQ